MARPRKRSGNLPAEVSSFVGRRRLLGEIRTRLSTARLVSLVGPGGVGKTRLALRIAGDLGRGFADGAWLIELAEVREGALVTNAVLTALDLRDQAAPDLLRMLLSYLQDKQLLLVLDNCEHLLQPVAHLVAEVLRDAPNVRVIATSREPLQVPGEHVIPVPTLELPATTGAEPLAELRQNEAVMLFVDRAAAASGKFDLTAANKVAVIDICRRLDGLPLAIELAAARTRVLSAQEIDDRLNDRFALLTGGGRAALPRHQTLRTTLDWSYDLLTAPEQVLLRRLSSFAGRFTRADVESVCVSDELPPSQVLDTLSALVDKSLAARDDFKGRGCYRLHETTREYADLKLREAKEEAAADERCLEYYRTTCLRLADDARYHLLEWLAWADMEIDNIRAVLHRCIAHGDLARGLDIAASLGYYWITRGTTESVRWLDQLLSAGEASPPTRVRALYLRGWLSLMQADPARARPLIARAMTAARGAGLLSELAQSLSLAATAENSFGDPVTARRFLDEAEALTRDLNDYPATIELLQARAIHAVFAGDTETGWALSSDGVRLSEEAGDLYLLESFQRHLASAAIMAGDLGTVKQRSVDALRLAREIDNRIAQYYGVSALAWHAASSRQPRLAAQLLGAAKTLGIGAGAEISGPFAPYLQQAKDSATAVLGPSKFDAEFNSGKALSHEAALRLALGEAAEVDGGRKDDMAIAPLAKRELDVARLVAEGLTNKQIAARLFMSEPTVATHMRNIMNKLGFNSRAQIAGWLASTSR